MIENKSESVVGGRSTAVQRRGVERVQAILDAAEALHGEQGYAAATLKAIGERAGIPTASLYHYFADRHQVDAALLQRHVSGLNESLTAALNDPQVNSLTEAVDAIVGPMFAYFRTHPSAVQLWFAGRDSTLSQLSHTFDESWAQQLWSFLVERGFIMEDTPALVVRLAFEAGDRVFDVAFQRSPKGDDETVVELRRMVTAYLQTYAPQALDR